MECSRFPYNNITFWGDNVVISHYWEDSLNVLRTNQLTNVNFWTEKLKRNKPFKETETKVPDLFRSSSSSFTLWSTLILDCFTVSSSSRRTSCSLESSSTLAIRSFFTIFSAFLHKANDFVRHADT